MILFVVIFDALVKSRKTSQQQNSLLCRYDAIHDIFNRIMPYNNIKQQIAVNKFRPLKKEMQSTFRNIKWALQDNKLPTPDMLAELTRQAEIMISYPGFGDKAYLNFVSACNKLCQLEKTGDIKTIRQQFQLIAELRCQCHEESRNIA